MPYIPRTAIQAAAGGQGAPFPRSMVPRSTRFTQVVGGRNATGSCSMLVDRMTAFAFAFAADATITEVYVNCSAAVASSSIRMGIYRSDAQGSPDVLLAELGTVSTATTGEKSITGLTQAVSAGVLYWFAYVTQGGASAPSCYEGNKDTLGLLAPATFTDASSYFWGAFSTTTVTGALPGSFPWAEGAGQSGTHPMQVTFKVQ